MSRARLLPLVLLAACGTDPAYIIVTIEARPAVVDVANMKVTLSNDGSAVSESFPLGDKTFPVTLSVSAEGRTGALALEVEATNADGLVVGKGTGESTIESPTASVMVDTVDFVVNTDYANDQELSTFVGEHGFQLAANTSGQWISTYRDACDTPCHVLGRRFDASGRPLVSQLAASTNSFNVSSELTTFFSTPAVAASASATLVVWNANVPPPAATSYSIECRAIDNNGGASANQVLVATDEYPDLVAIAALSNGNFAVAWEGRVTTTQIRTAVLKPDCGLLGPPVTASTTASPLPGESSVTSSGDRILYAWILDGGVRIRLASLANVLVGTDDALLVGKTATERIAQARVAPLPGGNFAVFVRWELITGATGPGRIEMLRLNNTGTMMGAAVQVTDRSGSDFGSSQSFGVAAKPDGSLLVVWHACEERGDGNLCGVFGRMISAAGQPVGTDFSLATTIAGNQTGPSAVALPGDAFAVAWTDASQLDPDRSGTAVRARVIYPPTTSQ